MKKVFGTCILLLIFMGNLVCARTSEKNVSIVNAIIVSNDILIALLNSIDPGDSVETITNKDEIIFYDARVDVINPDKKHYTFKVICEDTKGDVIIQSVFKQSPYIVEDYIKRVSVDGLGRRVSTSACAGYTRKNRRHPQLIHPRGG